MGNTIWHRCINELLRYQLLCMVKEYLLCNEAGKAWHFRTGQDVQRDEPVMTSLRCFLPSYDSRIGILSATDDVIACIYLQLHVAIDQCEYGQSQGQNLPASDQCAPCAGACRPRRCHAGGTLRPFPRQIIVFIPPLPLALLVI